MKLKYILWSTGANIKHNKIPYLILYFSNAVGLLLPLMFIGVIAYNQSNMIEYRNINHSGLAIVEAHEFIPQVDDMVENLSIEAANYQYRCMTNVSSPYNYSLCRLIATDEQYVLFYNPRFVNGEFFTRVQVENGARVCVVSYDLAKKLFKDQEPIGKYLTIDDIELEVIGVVRNTADFVSVFAPISAFKREPDGEIREKSYLLMFPSGTDVEGMQSTVEGYFREKNIESNYRSLKSMLNQGIGPETPVGSLLLGIAIFMTLFVILNVSNILYSLIDAEKGQYKLKYALGISKKLLITERIVSIFVVSLLSFLTSSIILLIIFVNIDLPLELLINSWVRFGFPALILTFVFSIVEGYIMIRQIYRRNERSILTPTSY